MENTRLPAYFYKGEKLILLNVQSEIKKYFYSLDYRNWIKFCINDIEVRPLI